MMKPTARQVKQMVAHLEGDSLEAELATPEEFAEATIALAWRMFEERARWAVVGKLLRGPDGYATGRVPYAVLTGYATRRQAEQAGMSLAYNPRSGEQWLWVAAEVTNDTPAAFHAARKDQATKWALKRPGDTCQQVVAYGDGWIARCIGRKGHPEGLHVEGPREHPGEEQKTVGRIRFGDR